jgi:starch phosphorylase
LTDNLRQHDPFLCCADFRSYLEKQGEVSECFRDEERWKRMSILNVARIGYFSSDRAVREYCEDIWKVRPVSVGDSL